MQKKHMGSISTKLTSSRRAAATMCPLPLFSPVSAEAPRAAEQTATWQQFLTANTFPRLPLQLPNAPTRRWVKQPEDLDLWPFDLESGVRVTCDVSYLCANFGLPRPLCSRLRPDGHDRQTDVRKTDRQTDRQKHRLMPPPIRVGGIKMSEVWNSKCHKGDTSYSFRIFKATCCKRSIAFTTSSAFCKSMIISVL